MEKIIENIEGLTYEMKVEKEKVHILSYNNKHIIKVSYDLPLEQVEAFILTSIDEINEGEK